MNSTIRRLGQWSAMATMAVSLPASARASVASIGETNSSQTYSLNTLAVNGKHSLECQQRVESGAAVTFVTVHDRARFDLNPQTRGRFCDNSAVIEIGTTQFAVPASFRIETGIFRITPIGGSQSRAKLELNKAGVLSLQVINGSFRVANSKDGVLAQVHEGESRRFQAAVAPAVTDSQIVGCLQFSNGHYSVRDENSNLQFVVQGDGLSKHVSQRVVLLGSEMTPSPDALGLKTSEIKMLSKTCVCDSVVPSVIGQVGVAAGLDAAAVPAVLSGTNDLASPGVK